SLFQAFLGGGGGVVQHVVLGFLGPGEKATRHQNGGRQDGRVGKDAHAFHFLRSCLSSPRRRTEGLSLIWRLKVFMFFIVSLMLIIDCDRSSCTRSTVMSTFCATPVMPSAAFRYSWTVLSICAFSTWVRRSLAVASICPRMLSRRRPGRILPISWTKVSSEAVRLAELLSRRSICS